MKSVLAVDPPSGVSVGDETPNNQNDSATSSLTNSCNYSSDSNNIFNTSSWWNDYVAKKSSSSIVDLSVDDDRSDKSLSNQQFSVHLTPLQKINFERNHSVRVLIIRVLSKKQLLSTV